MRKLFLTVLTLLVLSGPAFAWDQGSMNRQVDQTNYVLNDNCSATLVDAETGTLLTAGHCMVDLYTDIVREEVDDKGVVTKKTVRISRPAFVRQKIRLAGDHRVAGSSVSIVDAVAIDTEKDLALVRMRLKPDGLLASTVACRLPKRGDTVWAVGNSFGVLDASVTKGVVASVERTYRDVGIAERDNTLTQITAPIEGGNSGGALYNDNGELIGVPVMRVPYRETFGFAVSLEDIKGFLKANGMERLYGHCS